jgi:hypothetical protein
MPAKIWNGAFCPPSVVRSHKVMRSSQHTDVLGKRLVLDSTDRESHFLSRFENVVAHNVGQSEGNLGAVRAINNSKPLRVHFFDDSRHFVGFSPGKTTLVQPLPLATRESFIGSIADNFISQF